MKCTMRRVAEGFACHCGNTLPPNGGKIPECGQPKIRGLGDVIERITTATGIKAAVAAVSGGDCGCKKRRDKLNEMFPL